MDNPKISIIIPVYNGANYMHKAIDSALAQTYENIEIIVVNDGSNDGGETDRIAKSYGNKIRYFLKENGGSSSALNCGIKNMTGDYFAWLSHDDVYEPKRIEETVKRLTDDYKQIVICAGNLMDANGNPIVYAKKRLNGSYTDREMIKAFSKNYGINGCAVLVSKKLIDEVGFFDESLVYVNDYDYWYRLCFSGANFDVFDERLVKTRLHKNQVTVTKAQLFFKENDILAKRNFDIMFKDIEYYHNSILDLLHLCAMNQQKKVIKYAYRKIKESDMEFRISDRVNLAGTMCCGKIYNLLKNAYKFMFFKR